MVQPIIDPTLPAEQRQQQNRAQGIATATGAPSWMARNNPGVIDADKINQVYGILAQGANDPTAIGMNYVNAMQRQQADERKNMPVEQFLQIYGKVNPHDWSAESLQQFHTNFLNTGQLQFDVLKPRRGLTSKDREQIYEADTAMKKASARVTRIGDLLNRFNNVITADNYTQGLYGTVDQWLKNNITGNIDEVTALKNEYQRFRNEGVIQGLPPGVASDRDIAIAREGWPGPNVDPAYLAAFVRGMRKIAVAEYAQNFHKSNYIGAALSPQGLSSDWEKTKQDAILSALRANGLTLYKPEGNMSNEEAARQWYRSGFGGVGAPGTAQVGSPATSADQGAGVSDNDVDAFLSQ